MKTHFYFTIITFLALFVSCENNHNAIELENKEWNQNKAIRLDQVLSKSNDAAFIHEQYTAYPELYENFYSRMLRMGASEDLANKSKVDSLVIPNLNAFINDTSMKLIFKGINEKFSNLEYYENEISKGFARTNQLFGTSKNISIGTFYSNFNATVLENDNVIWIGLDMYLGTDHPIIDMLPITSIPQFYKDKMREKYIVSDVFFGYLMSIIYKPLGDEFLARMLAYGKIAYVMSLILPDENEGNKFRYDDKEINWCKSNEENIWRHIIDNQLLFEKDPSKVDLFFNDAPFTKNFGKDSPSGIGIWLGYQIIADYAKKTKQSVKEIIKEENIQKLLSTYEPNK